MTTINNIAQRILDENNYATGDISLTNLEYRIDDYIILVNAQAGTSIAALSGSAESKSITGTDTEILAVKLYANLLIQAYKEKGPNVNLGPMSITQVLNDPEYAVVVDLIGKIIASLKNPPIYLSEDEVPTT